MASVSKTRNGYWRVLWRDDQKVKRQKNFRTAAEARKFAAALELSPERRSSTITVSDWLVSYRDNESQKKRGAKQEVLRINRFLQRPFASMKLGELSFRDLQKYFDDRLKEPSQKYIGTLAPATAHKELKTLSAAFNAAVKSGLIPKNPCIGVVLPKPAEHRERTASAEDIEALLVASGWDGKSVPMDKLQLTMAAFLLACKTGMRSEEILRIEEAWIDGAVIHLPHISNFTDFAAFERMPGVSLRYVQKPGLLGDPDLILIPGTKNTMDDMQWLRESGMEALILRQAEKKTPVIGICGGFQILGKELEDPDCVEHGGTMRGMGLLDTRTVFSEAKTRTQTEGVMECGAGLWSGWEGRKVTGYEIHMGVTENLGNCRELVRLADGRIDALANQDGSVLGSYLHGIFDTEGFAEETVCRLMERKGLEYTGEDFDLQAHKEQEYDKLADLVRRSLDMKKIYEILEAGI